MEVGRLGVRTFGERASKEIGKLISVVCSVPRFDNDAGSSMVLKLVQIDGGASICEQMMRWVRTSGSLCLSSLSAPSTASIDIRQTKDHGAN